MKPFTLLFLLFFCVSNSCVSTDVTSKRIKKVIIKTYAKCMACKNYLENTVVGKKGIVFAELDLRKEILIVKYDSKILTPKAVKELVAEKGFPADDLKPNMEIVKQLPKCCVRPSPKVE